MIFLCTFITRGENILTGSKNRIFYQNMKELRQVITSILKYERWFLNAKSRF